MCWPVFLKALRYLALLLLLVATTGQADECELEFEATPVGTSQATRGPVGQPIVVAPTAETMAAPSTPTSTTTPGAIDPPNGQTGAQCIPSPIFPFQFEILDNGRSDGQDDIVWNFQWTECESADGYNLVVKHKNAGVPLIDTNVSVPEYEFVQSGGFISDSIRQDWMWEVRVLKKGVRTEWSETSVFEVEPVDTDDPYGPFVRLIRPAPGDVVPDGFLVTGVAERVPGDSSIWVALRIGDELFLWGQAGIFESARQEAVVEWQVPIIISDELQQRSTNGIVVMVAGADLNDSFDALFFRSLGEPVQLMPSTLNDVPHVEVEITVSNQPP